MNWTRDRDRGIVIKQDGKCYVKSQWRYCPYWVTMQKRAGDGIISREGCLLFGKEKMD